jgi:hypothetical protein
VVNAATGLLNLSLNARYCYWLMCSKCLHWLFAMKAGTFSTRDASKSSNRRAAHNGEQRVDFYIFISYFSRPH